MSNFISSGSKAEIMVAAYLRKSGYIISKMNYHSKYGEIDIIAENRERVIFVEVKMRGKDAIVAPAEAVDAFKQRKILLTAKDYLLKAHLGDLELRFDVAEVFEEESTAVNKRYRLHYIRNAFGNF